MVYRWVEGGFSLVELLVAISIIMLVSAVAIPSVRNFNNTQEVEASASALASALSLAQSSARTYIKCPADDLTLGWSVVLTGSNYTLRCLGANSPLSPQSVYTRNYASSLNSTTTFLQSNSASCSGALTLTFVNQQMSYDCAGAPVASWPLVITLQNSGATASKTVVIQQGGAITVN